jgi:D-erythro-7,8-dihydroneopterin triphosphate epimerase
MAIIRIKNLKVNTIIGFNPEERINKQDVIINFEIEVDITDAIQSDDNQHIYDYKAVKKSIITMVEKSQFMLLEKLTNEILTLIMKDSRVLRAKVEVDKPYALRYADSVSVEIEAKR